MKYKEYFEKLTVVFKAKKKGRIIVILCIFGLVMLIVSSFIPDDNDTVSNEIEDDSEKYVALLEEKIENTVQTIVGAGKTKVMITLECGVEHIYATKEKKSEDSSQSSKNNEYTQGVKNSGEENYIVIDTKDGEQALLVTDIAPKVKGVVVVCEGGGNSEIVKMVKSAVTTALNISENKVCVTAMK